MHLYIHTYIYVYYIHLSICIYIHAHIFIYIYKYEIKNIDMSMCMFLTWMIINYHILSHMEISYDNRIYDRVISYVITYDHIFSNVTYDYAHVNHMARDPV